MKNENERKKIHSNYSTMLDDKKNIGAWARDAINVTTTAMNLFSNNKDQAKYIVEEFDRLHGNDSYWQCFILHKDYGGSWVRFNNDDYFLLEFRNYQIVLFRWT